MEPENNKSGFLKCNCNNDGCVVIEGVSFPCFNEKCTKFEESPNKINVLIRGIEQYTILLSKRATLHFSTSLGCLESAKIKLSKHAL